MLSLQAVRVEQIMKRSRSPSYNLDVLCRRKSEKSFIRVIREILTTRDCTRQCYFWLRLLAQSNRECLNRNDFQSALELSLIERYAAPLSPTYSRYPTTKTLEDKNQ